MLKTLLFAFLICLIAIPSYARIDIVPQKIVIESRDRNGEFTVLNLMDVAGTFRIEIVNFSQDEMGVYAEQANPLNADFVPSDIARLSPRQFRIESGGRQKVRLSLRKPANLPVGEYRFHIKATRLAQEDERRNSNADGVSVVANIGVTIPVVIRHGQISGQASIENIELVPPQKSTDNKPELKLEINRTGQASTVGILEILWMQPNNQAKTIGRIKNMNIFTDIEKRYVKIPLYEMPIGQGELRIRYLDSVDKGKIFDEEIYRL